MIPLHRVQISITSCKLWKEAGRPRSGSIFSKYRSDKAAYKHGIRLHERNKTQLYTNELHEALLQKDGVAFWKCWKSKLNASSRPTVQVSGITDQVVIAEHFAAHFSKACSYYTVAGNTSLRDEYLHTQMDYSCLTSTDTYDFDAKLVETVIAKMKRGKAAGLDGITAEHLQYCHPLLCTVLAKVFNPMVKAGCVPCSFGRSYTIPLLKNSSSALRTPVSVDDFRGISISPVLYKVLEHCILDRYTPCLKKNDNDVAHYNFNAH